MSTSVFLLTVGIGAFMHVCERGGEQQLTACRISKQANCLGSKRESHKLLRNAESAHIATLKNCTPQSADHLLFPGNPAQPVSEHHVPSLCRSIHTDWKPDSFTGILFQSERKMIFCRTRTKHGEELFSFCAPLIWGKNSQKTANQQKQIPLNQS